MMREVSRKVLDFGKHVHFLKVSCFFLGKILINRDQDLKMDNRLLTQNITSEKS